MGGAQERFPLNDLFGYFQENATDWTNSGNHSISEVASITGRSNKRPRADAEQVLLVSNTAKANSTDDTLRFRFFQAIAEIETTGVAKLRNENGNLVFERRMRIWVQES